MGEYLTHTLPLLLAYLAGSIPFGLILGRLAGLGDIRKVGSGNIGATNMMRAGGKKLGALTLLLDAAKGWLGVWLGWQAMMSSGPIVDATVPYPEILYYNLTVITGLCSVIGHMFPIWLKFRGGKGIATIIGMCFGLDLVFGLAFIGIWLAGFALTRISAVGGLAASIAMPLLALVMPLKYVQSFCNCHTAMLLAVASILTLYKHRDNIRRMRKGAELGFATKRED